MKRIVLVMFVLLLCFGMISCKKESEGSTRSHIPTLRFPAYTTLIQQSKDDMCFVYHDADSQNILLWINSCPITAVTNADISCCWDYQFMFFDSNDIVYENEIYYMPCTAQKHTVWINSQQGVIQFDNISFLLSEDERNKDFFDGINSYINSVSQ